MEDRGKERRKEEGEMRGGEGGGRGGERGHGRGHMNRIKLIKYYYYRIYDYYRIYFISTIEKSYVKKYTHINL